MMTSVTQLLSMDDNMGLTTPNFFSSAWSLEQSEFCFTEVYQSSTGNHIGYTPPFYGGQAENSPPDYLSSQQGDHNKQSVYQSQHQPGLSQSCDNLDQILGVSVSEFLNKNTSVSQPGAIFNPSNLNSQVWSSVSYDNSLFDCSGLGVPSLDDWNLDLKQNISPTRIVTQIGSDSDRGAFVRYGQVTPVDWPQDDTFPPAQETARQSTSKNKGDGKTATKASTKVKRLRKLRKKKPMTKEQEESKRQRFLERNRVAADKCRQNRKKWIEDLQTKAHHLGADNRAKRAQLEDLEQEVVQLRSLMFIHSRSCNEKDIVDWIEHEADKFQLWGGGSKQLRRNSLSKCREDSEEILSPASRPTSSLGYGSVNEAVSRRYSAARADEDDDAFRLAESGCSSVKSSRRPSTSR